MNHTKEKEFWGAIAMFVVLMIVTASLFVFEIPAKNEGSVKLIIGVLVGGFSPIIYRILGTDPAETEKKNAQIKSLEAENEELRTRVNHLESMFIDLQNKVIDKLSSLQNINHESS